MKQAYTFRLLYGGDDNFVRDLEVSDGQTLADLHQAIQQNLRFDPTQLASFFLTDASWEKGEEIPVIRMNDDQAIRTMDQVRIKEKGIEELDRLLYVFDFLSNRGFFIELVNTSSTQSGVTYPRCIREEGNPPEQITMDEDLSFLSDEGETPEDNEDISFEDIDNLDI